MKKMTSWLLAIIMIVSCITPVMAMPEDGAKAAMTMSDEGMKLLKAEEGFNQYPYWDTPSVMARAARTIRSNIIQNTVLPMKKLSCS